MPAVFIGPDLASSTGFGPLHPLGQSRQRAVRYLCADMGWLSNEEILAPLSPDRDVLERFHEPHYVSALKLASDNQHVTPEHRARYHFGTMENPVFSGLFERASGTVGGSILAAQHALNGACAFHPAGGTHHGRPDRASGFCYFNDPLFALFTLLDAGVDKIAYVDLDAHHGDGVQDGIGHDPRVALASIHEIGRWPGTGALDDRADSGRARNGPAPRGMNDSELLKLVREGVLPHLESHGTEAVVITCGADALIGDPLSGLEVSNVGLWKAVMDIVREYPRAVLLGGGGYNPWTTTRAWAGLWGVLRSGADIAREVPDTPLPPASRKMFSGFESDLVDEDEIDPRWISHIDDRPNDGPIRSEIDEILRAWAE